MLSHSPQIAGLFPRSIDRNNPPAGLSPENVDQINAVLNRVDLECKAQAPVNARIDEILKSQSLNTRSLVFLRSALVKVQHMHVRIRDWQLALDAQVLVCSVF